MIKSLIRHDIGSGFVVESSGEPLLVEAMNISVQQLWNVITMSQIKVDVKFLCHLMGRNKKIPTGITALERICQGVFSMLLNDII